MAMNEADLELKQVQFQDTDRDERVFMVLDRFERAQAARTHQEEIWREALRIYRFKKNLRPVYDTEGNIVLLKGKVPQGEEWRSNIFIPYAFALVETVQPRMTAAMFASRPIFFVLGRSPEDHNHAPAVEALLDFQAEVSGLQEAWKVVQKSALIFGTGVGKIGWGRAGPVGGRSAYVGPLLKPVYTPDFYPDPSAMNLDECMWVIHRIFMPLDRLRKLAEEPDNDGVYDLAAIERLAGTQAPEAPMRDQLERALGATGHFSDRPGENIVELLEMWDVIQNRVIVVANRQVVIRDTENPYAHGQLPFVVIKDHLPIDSFWGIGEVEPIIDLQRELNTTRNQRIDNVSLALAAPVFINMMALPGTVDPASFRWEKGKVYPVMGPANQAVFIPAIPDVTAGSYREEMQVKADMQTVLGVHDVVQGRWPVRRETATAVIRLMQEANARFAEKIREFADSGLSVVARHYHALDAQFLSVEMAVRILGAGAVSFINIRPDEIQGAFDFRVASVAAEPAAAREERLSKLVELSPLLLQSGVVDPYRLIRQILILAEIPPDQVMMPRAEAAAGVTPGGGTQQVTPLEALARVAGMGAGS